MGLFFAMQFHMLNQYQHNIFKERAFTHIMVGTIWFLVNQQVSLWKEPMMYFYSMLIWSMLTIRSCLDVLVVWMGWSVASQQNSGWVGWSSVAAGQQNSGWLVNFMCEFVSCLMFYMVIILEEEDEEEDEDGRHY